MRPARYLEVVLRRVVVAAAGILSLVVAGCAARVESLASTQEGAVVLTSAGETRQLEVTALDAAGQAIEKAKVAFSSADPSVATVDESGKVTAVRSGMTEISARSGEVVRDFVVDVQIPETLQIQPMPPLTLVGMGTRVQMKADVLDALNRPVSGAEVEWEVADASIAELLDGGLLIARSVGRTQLTARFGSLSSTFAVNVRAPAFSRLDFGIGVVSVPVGKTLSAPVTAIGKTGNQVRGVPVRYESANEAIATVDPASGEIRGVKRGRTTVSAVSGEASVKLQVRVD